MHIGQNLSSPVASIYQTVLVYPITTGTLDPFFAIIAVGFETKFSLSVMGVLEEATVPSLVLLVPPKDDVRCDPLPFDPLPLAVDPFFLLVFFWRFSLFFFTSSSFSFSSSLAPTFEPLSLQVQVLSFLIFQ